MSILAQQHPVFQPAMRIISSITNANPAVVTTTFNHNYITGTVIRIDIPPLFGMQEINQQVGTIIRLTPTTFAINIDTTLYSAFSAPSTYPANAQYAQSNAIGEDNSILTAAEQNVLPFNVLP